MNNERLANELYELSKKQEYQGTTSILLIKAANSLLNTNNNENYKQLGSAIARFNSLEVTETCLIEEMSELSQAVCKHKRGRGNMRNTIEELGHVLLMCYALMERYAIDESSVLSSAGAAVQKMHDQSVRPYNRDDSCDALGYSSKELRNLNIGVDYGKNINNSKR